jgi:hypothetical protein
VFGCIPEQVVNAKQDSPSSGQSSSEVQDSAHLEEALSNDVPQKYESVGASTVGVPALKVLIGLLVGLPVGSFVGDTVGLLVGLDVVGLLVPSISKNSRHCVYP